MKLTTLIACATLTATGAVAADSDDTHLWKICNLEWSDGESELVLFWERQRLAKIKFDFGTVQDVYMEFVGDKPYVLQQVNSRTVVTREGYNLSVHGIGANYDKDGNLESVNESVMTGRLDCPE